MFGRRSEFAVTDLSGCESAPAAIDASEESAGSWGIDALWCRVEGPAVVAEEDRGLASPAAVN